MAKLLAGKAVAEALTKDCEERVAVLGQQGIVPGLALLRVGDRPDDMAYERTAIKRAEALGVAVRSVVLPADATQATIEAAIDDINADPSVHGCLMFRPLAKGIDERAVCDRLSAAKDVEGISSGALASVFMGEGVGFAPCTAASCMHILDFYDVELAGADVVVVGRSLVIGRPVAMMLQQRNATVTLCHSRTRSLPEKLCRADVVVCATGRARAYGVECFAPGQTVVDVGTNFNADGKMCGDDDFENVEPEVSAITPVPGGVGSVTTAVLMANVITAAERSATVA